ncbi:MAG: efflux RND transporter periplasmic adaptor subunit [Cyanobacteria bacterium P01_H01_bin.15]
MVQEAQHEPKVFEDEDWTPQQEPESAPTRSGRGILIGLVLGLAIAGIGSRLLAPKAPTSAPMAVEPVAEASNAIAQTVSVGRVNSTLINRELDVTGTVAAQELISVSAQATGRRIEQVLVDEGDFVQPGQLLVRLDNAVLQAELAQAQAAVDQAQARLAELEAGTRAEEIAQAKEAAQQAQARIVQAESDLSLAEKRVKRNQDLQVEGAIALDVLDEVLNDERTREAQLREAQANLRQLKAQLELLEAGPRPETIAEARAQLAEARAREQLVLTEINDTQILAPVAGEVAERQARIGDVTANGTPLFQIIQDGRLELRLALPETDLRQIQIGQAVNLTTPSGLLTGTVREINPLIDATSRQATVDVDLPANSGLRPGMFLRGEVVVKQTSGLTVPSSALLPQGDRTLIYVLQPDSSVKAQPVVVGELLPDEKVEIIEGVAPGMQVVTEGAAFLQDGIKVEVANR